MRVSPSLAWDLLASVFLGPGTGPGTCVREGNRNRDAEERDGARVQMESTSITETEEDSRGYSEATLVDQT